MFLGASSVQHLYGNNIAINYSSDSVLIVVRFLQLNVITLIEVGAFSHLSSINYMFDSAWYEAVEHQGAWDALCLHALINACPSCNYPTQLALRQPWILVSIGCILIQPKYLHYVSCLNSWILSLRRNQFVSATRWIKGRSFYCHCVGAALQTGRSAQVHILMLSFYI